jgi:hypothetical protein
MINKSSTWQEANAYFDKQIEAHFDKKPALSETIVFLENLSIEFIQAGQYYLAIACISAINTYKNAGDTGILKRLSTSQTIRKAPETLSQVIFKKKLTEKGDDAMETKNLTVAFEIYNMVAETDPRNPEIWKKRLDTLSELLL